MAEVLWADYAYPGVDLTGYAGVVRYLQTDNGSRRSAHDLTRAEVDWHHSEGRPVALFWQDGASSAGLGGVRGISDSDRAHAAAALIGVPGHVPIHYAVDDPTLDGPKVAPYFQALLDQADHPVGAYGSYAVCEWLAANLGIEWLIQTSSWSAGKVSGHAWLLQRDHNVPSGTSKVDIDPLLLDLPGAAWQPPGAHMARWPTYDELVAVGQRVAAQTGARLIILDGARGRCRCCSGAHNPSGPFIRPLGPFIGVTRHLTAGGLGTRTVEQYCWNILVNDPSVPFKCQWAVGPGGKELVLLGVGRANHMLNMSRAAYNALVAGTLSLTEFCQNLRGSDLTGSTFTMGIEQIAATAPDAAQSNVTDHLVAELCKLPGTWTGVDQIGHGEGAIDRGPGDPNEHMGNKRVTSRNIVSGATPPPPTRDWFDMADAQMLNDVMMNVLQSREAVVMRAFQSGGQPSLPVIICTTEGEGGKIYSLMPGQPKHWLSPEEYALLGRLYPHLQYLTLGERPWGGRFLESEVDMVWAILQPKDGGVDMPALVAATVAAVKASLADVDVDEAELARQIIAQLAAPKADAPEAAPEYRGMTVADLPEPEVDPAGGPAPRSTEAQADAYEKAQQAKLAGSLAGVLQESGLEELDAQALAQQAVSEAASRPVE